MLRTQIPTKNVGYRTSEEKTYSFASYPRALMQQCGFNKKAKSREQSKLEEQLLKYGNVMYDRRVMRGSAIQQHTVSVGVPLAATDIHKQYAVRRRVIGRRPVKAPVRTFSPPPVRGRQHADVQTEIFLEELTAATEVYDEESQTDLFLDRPASPVFIQAKTGIDVQTQIYEGELFDFDLEVTPLLEVLVGKTIEQSLLEVVQEEEMASMREQQHRYEELRYAQLVEQQRLEEEEGRLRDEKVFRISQHEKSLINQEKTAEKVAAFAFAQNYLADLAPTVFQNLMDSNYFIDPITKDIEQGFMPWLMNQVVDKLNDQILERAILDEIVSQIVVTGVRKFAPLLPEPIVSELDLEITAPEESVEEENIEDIIYENVELLEDEAEIEYEEMEEEN